MWILVERPLLVWCFSSSSLLFNGGLLCLIYSALVWGSSAKHKPQRVGKVYSIPSCVLGFFFFFFLFHSIATFFFSLIHLYLICWLNTWLVLLTRQEHELEDEDVVQIIKKVWVLELGTIEQPTVERIFEHRVRLLLWDLFYIIPSYSRPKQSMSSLFHLEIR